MAKVLRKKATSKLDLGAPVSRLVELDSIFIVESEARRKQLRGELPADINLSVQVKTDTVKDKRIVQVRVRFELAARYDETAAGELLRIAAMFLLQYRLPSFEGLSKSNFNAFGEMNGVYNAWPYWREYVQATTLRMGLPSITIPVYRPVVVTKAARAAPSAKAKQKKRTPKHSAVSTAPSASR